MAASARQAREEPASQGRAAAGPGAGPGGAFGRLVLAAIAIVAIVAGAVLVPAGIAAAQAKAYLSDEADFVATLTPLIEDEQVQAYLAAQVSDAVMAQLDERVSAEQVLNAVGITVPSGASQLVLDALVAGARESIASTVHQRTTAFLGSSAATRVWQSTLTASHRATVSVLDDERSGALQVADPGQIRLEFAPIVTAARDQIALSSPTLAALIPDTDGHIVLVESTAVTQAHRAYALVMNLGDRVVWGGIALLALGLIALTMALVRPRVSPGRALTTALSWIFVIVAVACVLARLGVGQLRGQLSADAAGTANAVVVPAFDLILAPIDERFVSVTIAALIAAGIVLVIKLIVKALWPR